MSTGALIRARFSFLPFRNISLAHSFPDPEYWVLRTGYRLLTTEYTAAVLSLASAASWGTADFSGGFAARKANPFGVVIFAHSTGLLCMLALAWLTREPIPSHAALLWGTA